MYKTSYEIIGINSNWMFQYDFQVKLYETYADNYVCPESSNKNIKKKDKIYFHDLYDSLLIELRSSSILTIKTHQSNKYTLYLLL